MRLRIAPKDVLLLGVAAILLSVVALAGWHLFGAVGLIALALAATVLLLATLLEIYRRLDERAAEQDRLAELRSGQDYRQIESLLSLYFTLKPALPLPHARGMAASTDLLQKLVEVILAERPQLVVEASSGVSTLVIAHALKQTGKGRVVSLEHDERYAAITRNSIAFHALEGIASVVHAPLKSFDREGRTWRWYDLDDLKLDGSIDLLVVDGPPGHLQPLSRYPALPLLYPLLSVKSTIILDDGARADEREIAARWEKEFRLSSSEYLETENGAYLLRRIGPA